MPKRSTRNVVLVFAVAIVLAISTATCQASSQSDASAAPSGATILVPEQYRTIQDAIDAASSGDVISIAPGTYEGNLTLGAGVTLRGRTYNPSDPSQNTTILHASAGSVLTIPATLTPIPLLLGLVISGGHDGVTSRSPVRIRASYFNGNGDGLDFEIGAGGVVANNVFEATGDDGVDLDHAIRNVRIVNNRITNAGDDGIEIRLQDDQIPSVARIVIRGNRIDHAGEDGIQLIDYNTATNRWIIVRRNLIRNSTEAGFGLMDEGVTAEDYRAAPVDERVDVVNNTFVENDRGISGGARLYAVNNIFVGHDVALSGLTGASIAAHCLFWNNGTNQLSSRVDQASLVFGAPLLDASFLLGDGSPAIDAGTASYSWSGDVVVDMGEAGYRGADPDLGWREAA